MIVRSILASVLLLCATAGRSAAQTTDIADFLREVRDGTAVYRNADRAVQDGFRPVGPDAPGMGRHWVNIGRVLDGRFEPRRPAVLTYIEIEGELVLAGVAYAIPLSPGETPPGIFPSTAWHVHAGLVSDEGALFGHDMAPTEVQDQRGVAVLHVWAWTENPDGLVTADNWALPFARRKLAPPPTERTILRTAALGLALADGADEFVLEILQRHYLDDDNDRNHARQTLSRHAQLQKQRLAAGQTPSATELASIWDACWEELRSGLTAEGRQAVDRLTGTHAGHRSS